LDNLNTAGGDLFLAGLYGVGSRLIDDMRRYAVHYGRLILSCHKIKQPSTYLQIEPKRPPIQAVSGGNLKQMIVTFPSCNVV